MPIAHIVVRCLCVFLMHFPSAVSVGSMLSLTDGLYRRVSQGTCRSNGLIKIRAWEDCEKAATWLKLKDKTIVEPQRTKARQSSCIYAYNSFEEKLHFKSQKAKLPCGSQGSLGKDIKFDCLCQVSQRRSTAKKNRHKSNGRKHRSGRSHSTIRRRRRSKNNRTKVTNVVPGGIEHVDDVIGKIVKGLKNDGIKTLPGNPEGHETIGDEESSRRRLRSTISTTTTTYTDVM